MSTAHAETAVATASSRPQLAIARGVQITDIDGLWRFATAVAKSGLAPKGIQTPEAIFIAIEMGLEVGLPPMSALQNIAVINGRPSIWGDAQLAVCRGTGEVEEFVEWYEQGGKKLARNPTTFGDDTTAVCRVKRRGYEAAETAFSVADSKQAKLWGKEGPWSQYPGRMLRFRARSFALRDTFGDALKGLRAAEEVMDDPAELNVTPAPAVRFDAPAPATEPTKRRARTTEATAPTAEPQPPAEHSVVTQAEPAPAVAPVAAATVAPAAPSEPDPAADPHGYIDAKLSQYGVPFDDFAGWLKTTGLFEQADSMANIDDLPKPVAARLVADKAAQLRKCVTIYSTKGGAQ
jgi:hypothetical protein